MARLCTFDAALVLILFAAAATVAVPARATASYPTVLDNSAPIAAQQLERLYRQIRPAFWQNADAIPDMPTGTGDAYELTANFEGRVGCGGPDMLMLKMNGASIDALIPPSFSPRWLDNGEPLRLIVRDNVQPENSTAPGYLVLAIAPEAEVIALEKASVPRQAAYRTNRPLSSRGRTSALYMQSRDSWRTLPSNLPPGHPVAKLSPEALAVYPYYRAAVERYNRRLDSLTVDKITTSVLAYSDYYHLDPRLVMAMIIAESGFDPNSVSVDGAIGVGQLMPSTAAGLGVNPYDPVQNVGAAVEILSTRVNQYGGEDAHGLVPLNTLALTMAAYNAGPGAVRKYHGIPPYVETQNYVRKVAALYRAMCGG